MNIRAAALGICPPFVRNQLARIKASPLGYRLAKGAFWSLVGAVISRTLTLGASIFVARMLGKIGFGELGIIRSTVGLFGVFAGFGMGLTATKHVAEFRTKDPAKAGRILGLSGLVAVVTGGAMVLALMLLAPWLAANTLAAPHLGGLLRIGAALLFLNALNGAQTGALAGFEAFKTIAKVNVWAGVSAFPLMVGGVWLAGLEGAVWGLVASRAINWLLNHLALRREATRAGVPFSLAGCGREWKILFGFSLPAVLSGAMVSPVIWACHAMLVNRPNGYAEMGIFNAATVFRAVLYFLGATVGAPLLPMLVNMSDTSSDRLGRVNMLSTWFLGVIPALPLICFPELAQMLLGQQFSGPAFRRTFVLVMFFVCVVIYKQGLARVLSAHNLMWWSVLSNGFSGAVMLASAYFLVRWGAAGLAMSFAVAYAVNAVVFVPLYTSRRLVPKGTIVSPEAGLVWTVILALVAMTYLGLPVLCRVVSFPLAVCLVVGAFYRMMRARLT